MPISDEQGQKGEGGVEMVGFWLIFCQVGGFFAFLDGNWWNWTVFSDKVRGMVGDMAGCQSPTSSGKKGDWEWKWAISG